MSYILDALKKSQQPISDIDFNEGNSKDENSSGRSVNKPVNSTALVVGKLSFLFVAMFTVGYFSGGGLNIIEHSLKVSEPNLDSNENIMTRQLESAGASQSGIQQSDEELVWPRALTPHQDIAFFSQPERFNQKLISDKLAAKQEQEQYQLALEQEEKRQQQRILAEQVERVIKEQGLSVNSAVESAQEFDSDTARGQGINNDEIRLDTSKLKGVSNELLEAFQTAIDEENSLLAPEQLNQIESNQTNSRQTNRKQNKQAIKPNTSSAANIAKPAVNKAEVKPLTQMPQWYQNAIPSLKFSLHMYSSEQSKSWLRLNNEDYNAGDITREGIVIEAILPQKVVLQYEGKTFSLKALSTW